MYKKNEFNLKNFQSEVFEDFRGVKATIGFSRFYSKGYKSIESHEDFYNLTFSRVGCLTRGIVAFFNFLGKRANKNVLNQLDFIEKDKKAEEVINHPKIKNILCPALKANISSDLFIEGRQVRIVKVVTTKLFDEQVLREFSIEKDVRLFSLIALKIYQKGISDYCN